MDPGEAWVSTLAEADGKKQGILSQLSHTHGLKMRMKAEYAEAEGIVGVSALPYQPQQSYLSTPIPYRSCPLDSGCVQPPPNRPVSGTGFAAFEGAGGKSEQRKRQYHFYMSIY